VQGINIAKAVAGAPPANESRWRTHSGTLKTQRSLLQAQAQHLSITFIKQVNPFTLATIVSTNAP